MDALCKVSSCFSPFNLFSQIPPPLLRISSERLKPLAIEGKEKVPSEESNVPCIEKFDMPGSDVDKLFAYAQRNIMHINKLHLLAMEDANRLKMENASLLKKLEQLKTEMKRTLIEFEGKNSALVSSLSLSELLLHIDSMVIWGFLSKGEASELRKKLMESKVAIHDALGDIHHKTNAV